MNENVGKCPVQNVIESHKLTNKHKQKHNLLGWVLQAYSKTTAKYLVVEPEGSQDDQQEKKGRKTKHFPNFCQVFLVTYQRVFPPSDFTKMNNFKKENTGLCYVIVKEKTTQKK